MSEYPSLKFPSKAVAANQDTIRSYVSADDAPLSVVRFGIRFLMLAFRHFGLRSRAGLHVWVAIFLLVSLQMTTALRPLLGSAETVLLVKKTFFITHWLDCTASRPPEPRVGADR
jgi:hypothetical protein